MWQDVLVSVVAIGAAVMLGRKWFRPKKTEPGCASCESNPATPVSHEDMKR